MGSLALTFLALGVGTSAHGTAVEDSLQAAVHGAVSAHQRTQALLVMAERVMDSNPVEAHGHARNALNFAEQAADVDQANLVSYFNKIINLIIIKTKQKTIKCQSD